MFCMNPIVHGHHISKDIWTSAHDEELNCKHKIGTIHDLYAVFVIKQYMGIIGHLPR